VSDDPQATAAGFGSPRAAALAGMRRAIGVPILVLSASFLGFGALVHQSGLSLWHGLFSTATGWALPGQIAFVELYSVGASLAVIALAVALVNARLMPMTITLMPYLRAPGTPRWAYYVASHWIAVTAWAAMMRDWPRMPQGERLPYFVGMGLVLWGGTLVTTALGYGLAGAVPLYVTLGLVFVNPIYFMLVFAADVRARGRILALLIGAASGPALHVLTPDFGLLLTGVIAGSVAFLADRHWSRRRG